MRLIKTRLNLRALALLAFACTLLVACKDHEDRPSAAAVQNEAQATSEAKARAEMHAMRRQCTDTLQTKRGEYGRLVEARMYREATLQLRVCAEVLEDESLKAMVSSAENKARLKAMEIPNAAAREKAEAQDRVKAAASKRREGVRIGMSHDEVIASSWGKPQSISRSTYSFGVHEQWVYGGRNYLYFENGKLVSIQN